MPGTDALSRAPSSADLLMLQHFDADYEEEELHYEEDSYGLLRLQTAMKGEDIETMEDGEDEILATIDHATAALTWQRIRDEVEKDSESQDLLNWTQNGVCDTGLNGKLTPYWRHRSNLRELDGVPMLSERTIIPKKLRQEVLNTLHSAHQGVNSMMLRACDTVYWPSFKADIEKVRERCLTCTAIAPSQPHLPPVDPEVPLYPFQHVCMDHFALNGKTYGVVVDRFTNWPCIYVGDASVDVCKTLAKLSEDYGIPETVSTDGSNS